MYPNYNLNASANKVSPPYKSTISLLEYFNIKRFGLCRTGEKLCNERSCKSLSSVALDVLAFEEGEASGASEHLFAANKENRK